VCGRCTEGHHTEDCPITDTGTFKCSNCKVSGHGAADCLCPFFQNEQQRRRSWDPSSGYRYFPTDDPRTWAASGAESMDGAVSQGFNSGGRGWLAGGHAGQGGGAPVDGGWVGARIQRQAPAAANSNQWAQDGRWQPPIGEAFQCQQDGSSQRQ
jgi:hypothetical protein